MLMLQLEKINVFSFLKSVRTNFRPVYCKLGLIHSVVFKKRANMDKVSDDLSFPCPALVADWATVVDYFVAQFLPREDAVVDGRVGRVFWLHDGNLAKNTK